jgi:hypothetical protein
MGLSQPLTIYGYMQRSSKSKIAQSTMGFTMGLNLLLLLAMVATNILSLPATTSPSTKPTTTTTHQIFSSTPTSPPSPPLATTTRISSIGRGCCKFPRRPTWCCVSARRWQIAKALGVASTSGYLRQQWSLVLALRVLRGGGYHFFSKGVDVDKTGLKNGEVFGKLQCNPMRIPKV